MQPHDENFVTLQKALKLKRYEQPPPGYFNNFSRDVISRIRAGDVQDRLTELEKAHWEAPWLVRVIELFQTKPVFVGLLGAAACVMVLGIVVSEQGDLLALPGGQPGQQGTVLSSESMPGVGLAATPSTPLPSTTPIAGELPRGTTLFDRLKPNIHSAPAFSGTNLLPIQQFP